MFSSALGLIVTSAATILNLFFGNGMRRNQNLCIAFKIIFTAPLLHLLISVCKENKVKLTPHTHKHTVAIPLTRGCSQLQISLKTAHRKSYDVVQVVKNIVPLRTMHTTRE